MTKDKDTANLFGDDSQPQTVKRLTWQALEQAKYKRIMTAKFQTNMFTQPTKESTE